MIRFYCLDIIKKITYYRVSLFKTSQKEEAVCESILTGSTDGYSCGQEFTSTHGCECHGNLGILIDSWNYSFSKVE